MTGFAVRNSIFKRRYKLDEARKRLSNWTHRNKGSLAFADLPYALMSAEMFLRTLLKEETVPEGAMALPKPDYQFTRGTSPAVFRSWHPGTLVKWLDEVEERYYAKK